jgi:hypothetical protein
MSVTITPKVSTSSIILLATGKAVISSSTFGDQTAGFAITDASNNFLSGGSDNPLGSANSSFSATHIIVSSQVIIAQDSPGSTSAKTYKLRFRATVSTTTVSLRNDQNPGQIIAIEVAA